ncbi:MAG: hypothetical protein KDA32_12350, partial [Phycisphaerales bacterium]|nr:hypothetical protein [Phycisphaerales bacterium]
GRLLRESYYAYELAMVAVTQSLLGQDFADIGAYPLASEVLAQNQDSLFGAAKVDGGIRWSYAGTGAVITIPVATMAFAISTALPELSHARANAKRVVSSANLRGIGMAAMIYHENHGAWPDSFDQLIEDQLVTRETIISPTVSDKVPVGYVLITGFSKDAAPTLILAYEKVTDVGQIPTLFMDGHVEILDYSTLSDMLRATYEALDEEPQDPVWGFE